MNDVFEPLEKSAPAGGQTQRLPGSTRDAALHDQLYRYAEDLQQMVERHGALEIQYEALRESNARLVESRAVLDGLMQSSCDIHIVTDGAGRILICNPACASPKSSRADVLRRTKWQRHWPRMRTAPASRRPRCATADCVGSGARCSQRGGAPHLHGIMRDITLLRKAEFEALISSVVLKSVAEGVMVSGLLRYADAAGLCRQAQ
jgi:PAS domain-containing protein